MSGERNAHNFSTDRARNRVAILSFNAWMNVEWWQIAFHMYLGAAMTSREQVISTIEFSASGFPLKKITYFVKVQLLE